MNPVPIINEKIIHPGKHLDLIKVENLSPGQTLKLKADAVVIGSGAGGAVAAAELSKNGWKVILLEEGGYFTPAKFNSDEFQSSARLYRDAGFIVSEDQTINILQGRSIGGSTTINWQTSLYPPDYVTDEWEKRFGLEGYQTEKMQPFINEVHERLGVHEVFPNLINKNNSVLMRGGKKLRLNPQILKNNNRGCIGLGKCGLGCPINAKQSMFLTYIPDALNQGATVFSNMRAVKIEDGKIKKVTAEFTVDPYEKAPEQIIEKLEVSAPVVISSAGAIEGPALLQRSGLGNDWVGKNLKVHPTCMIFAKFDEDIKMYSGPPQSIVIKDGHNQNNTGYGFWLESAPFRPTIVTSLIPFYGPKIFETMKTYNNLAAGIVLVRDGADGKTNASVKWSFGKRKVYYEITPTDGKNMLLGLKMLAEIQKAAGAKEQIFPFSRFKEPQPVTKETSYEWILNENIRSGDLSIGSAHPHGSIQAASSPKSGAVNQDLELFNHKNIFVMDACVYPTGLSVNPQITTMSVVLRAARKLAQQKKEIIG